MTYNLPWPSESAYGVEIVEVVDHDPARTRWTRGGAVGGRRPRRSTARDVQSASDGIGEQIVSATLLVVFGTSVRTAAPAEPEDVLPRKSLYSKKLSLDTWSTGDGAGCQSEASWGCGNASALSLLTE
jgi:hypothetical protein